MDRFREPFRRTPHPPVNAMVRADIEGFNGISRRAMTFLSDLRDDNNRDWFSANRSVYEETIKIPAERLLRILAPRLEVLAGHPVTGKIFRIHRDIRFSKDKSPYNAHLHMAFAEGGRGPGMKCEESGFYLALEPERLTLGAGVFELAGGALDNYRKAVADGSKGEAIAKIVAGLTASGFRLEGLELKRVPVPFEPDHPRADLLRRKGLSVWRDVTDETVISSPAFLRTCLATFETLVPLHRWIMATVEARNRRA